MVANDQYEKLYRQALLIRRVEEKIIDIYPSDNIQSPVHLSIGQEAVSVGLCAALERGDIIYGSYRSHALYIACGGDLTQMFAELMGRLGGISKGKAGSMHLSFPEQGLMGASAVVASHVPHAVGSALAARYRRTGQIVACVFGDGALEEGVSHECFNFAALKSLPILFLCENNGLAVHSHRRDRQAFAIEGLATLYGLPYRKVDEGWDFLEVCDACLDAGRSLRAGGRPQFLREDRILTATCKTARILDTQGNIIKTIAQRDPVSFAGVSQNGKRFALQVATFSSTHSLKREAFVVYSVETGEPIAEVTPDSLADEQSWTALSPDGSMIVVGSPQRLTLFRLP